MLNKFKFSLNPNCYMIVKIFRTILFSLYITTKLKEDVPIMEKLMEATRRRGQLLEEVR